MLFRSGWDLAQWSARVAAALPMKSMSIASATGTSGLVTYTIRISWDEPRGRQDYGGSGAMETMSYVLTKVVREKPRVVLILEGPTKSQGSVHQTGERSFYVAVDKDSERLKGGRI